MNPFLIRKEILPLSIVFFMLCFSSCREEDLISFPTVLLPPKVEGTWTGSVSGFVDLILHLSQERATISGWGVISGAGPTLKVSVHGTNRYPDIEFTIAIPGYEAMIVTGQLVDLRRIDGVVNGSGANNNPITFVRQ